MSALIGPRTGVVRSIHVLRPEAGDAPLAVVGTDVGDTSPLGGGGEVPASGAAHTDAERAHASAIGEAVERYCAAFAPSSIVTCAKDLDGAVTDWPLFTEHQRAHQEHAYVAPAPTLRMHWTEMADLATGGRVHVPTQMVALPFAPEGEPVLAPFTSTGLAAGPSLHDAVLAGVQETIERDAFALMWLTSATPPRIQREAWPATAARLARHGHVEVFDLTHDIGVPVVMCMLEKQSTVGNVVCVGAACRADPAAAIDKAVMEAFQSFPYVRHLVRREPAWRAAPDLSNLHDFRDHCRFYTVHPEHRPGVAGFLDDPPAERPAPGPTDRERPLEDAVRRMAAAGLPVLARELTTADVRQHGLRVVRVLCPGAQPLHGHHQGAHLDSDRLRRAHDILPWLDKPWTEEDTNRWPHPFA